MAFTTTTIQTTSPSFINKQSSCRPSNSHSPQHYSILLSRKRSCSSRQQRFRLYARPKSDKTLEEAEWKAFVAALQLYKAAYGDLKVPTRFIVPAMKPWPQNAWDMKLGLKVAAIRSTGKYIKNNESRRKLLDNLGFLWRVRTGSKENMDDVTFDQIYSALATYRKYIQPEGNTLTVPPNFIVPDCKPWPEATRGLPLGKKLVTVRTKAYLKQHPGATEKLRQLGFEFDGKVAANDARFNLVVQALERYKQIYGDLLVPQPFIVPSDSKDWPEETWGLRLGARVNAIRSQGTFVNTNPARRTKLDKMGFVWSPPTADGSRRRGRRNRESIEALMNSRGAGLFDGDEPPSMEDIFGPGFAYSDPFQQQATQPPQPPAGAKWGLEESKRQEERAKEAEQKAKEEEYTPERSLSESIKEATEKAISVGIIEETDDGRIKKGKREKNIPWYNDDFGDGFVFEDVVEALTVYKTIHTNFSELVTNDEFIVPANEEGDDDNKLGGTFDTTTPARAAAAIAAYEKEGNMDASQDLIAAEIERMKAEVASPLPDLESEMEAFASGEPAEIALEKKSEVGVNGWPEYLAGMPLGNIVRRIRDGSLEVKHLPERKEQLDAIDFDWGPPERFIDVPFEKAMCGMYAYFLIRGDMFVYEDFVIPDVEPWPIALAGHELGKDVKRIRELQNFFEAYHSDKVMLLRAIDFMWFPTMALPLDPNESEVTFEMMSLIAFGHPCLHLMRGVPMGLPEKIMADGPYFETDDPNQWWRVWYNWDNIKDYWYRRGRRDNAYWLRRIGYPMLAEEHEEKYGPGLYKQMNQTLELLKDDGILETMSKEEKTIQLKKLKYFRDEMKGCRDFSLLKTKEISSKPAVDEWPYTRKLIVEALDNAMLLLMEDGVTITEEEEDDDYKEELVYEGGANDEDLEDNDEYDEDEEFSLEDEFGFEAGADIEFN